ncbi:MAG: hypothetical protein MJZ41_00530 [Bacteroidaceae bacterium]|nr:hypothetical protein [Bacteroidaceae bacterium]
MKKIIAFVLTTLFFGTTSFAAENPTQTEVQQNTIIVKTSKASKPLVEAWANAYMQTNKDVVIEITSKQSAQADLVYVNTSKEQATDSKQIALVGRYAILPVTSAENPIIAELQKKEWNKNDIKKLYFSSLDEDIDEDEEASSGKAGKLREKLTVYSGTNASSTSAVFAQYYGFQTSELRGNKISGDDLYLLNAIDEDKQSITFNNIAYLYNTTDRQLKSNITILPLNVKKDVEDILQNGNLDQTLKVLEQQNIDLIPVESFGFAYDKLNIKAEKFLEWVVSDGQQYNNQKGFLRLGEKDAQNQLKELAQR